MSDLQREFLRLTQRTCRWCGKTFLWPEGERQQGCPACQPQLPGVESAAVIWPLKAV